MTKQNKNRKIVWLFGGGGYVGHFVAGELIRRGHCVVSYDNERALTLPNTVSLIDRTGQNVLSGTASMDALIHLACPRNKPGQWDLKQAQAALQQGLALGKFCTGPKIYVSSMSVYDEPQTAYGVFKTEAEKQARDAGFSIVRPGTVVGALPGFPYRADLALHLIMKDWANGNSCQVNARARRHIIPVWMLALALADEVTMRPEAKEPEVIREVTWGTVSYKDIVPMSVRRGKFQEKTVCPAVGAACSVQDCADLRDILFDFVKAIQNKENPAWPI